MTDQTVQMIRAFRAPRELVEKKPPHGAPCMRCGLCCMATLCRIGEHVFRQKQGPCPALRFDAQGSRCGLLDDATKPLRDAAKLLLYSGEGCDARFNGEPINHGFHHRLNVFDEEHAYEIDCAKKLWGLK